MLSRTNICGRWGYRWARRLTQQHYADPNDEKFSMTKIVGTIGPVSENYDTMQQLVHDGLRIMRINFSHATYEEADLRITNLKKCRGVHSAYGHNFNLRSILLDTQGPEIRTGGLSEKKILLENGNEIVLTTDSAYETTGTAQRLYVNYPKIISTVQPGDHILLDDGLVRLTVLEVAGQDVRCLINNTEQLGSRKGVNLPGLSVDLPILTDKDKQDIEYGIKNDIDFVAASFVRKPEDVMDIRAFIDETFPKYHSESVPKPQIISKIENFEGVRNFDEILKHSDGIMVARGDLGVEIPMQKVLTYQKHMVDKCNQAGKPVIVATQMLDSMIRNPRPTRAEVCDVGNAVLDGADAVMLSGEVAQGKYPLESVRTMLSVVKEADSLVEGKPYSPKCSAPECDVETIASSVVKTAHEIQARLIIVLTDTGFTARKVAKYHPNIPVMCYASCQKVGRQLQIHRGLYPICDDSASHRPGPFDAIKNAKDLGWIKTGDKVVLLHAEEVQVENVDSTQILMRIATA